MYRGRKESGEYKNIFGTDISGKVLSERLGMYMHQHTCYYGYRPLGTSALVGAYDPINKYTLHQLTPSGECTQYHGTATGRGKQAAKSEIEKRDWRGMTCADALDHVAKILLTCSEETKDKSRELEFAVIAEESKNEFKKLTADRCSEILT